MKVEVEISQIDRRHEGNRLKSSAREQELLASILMRGIEEPLQGVLRESEQAILLDGFKRLRCALRLGKNTVPFISLGTEEAEAILQMIRSSNAKTLTLLEQAAFVEDLRNTHGLRVDEIARRLEKSKAWVLVRLKTLSEMSEKTSEALLSGKFPLSSYFYTLHPIRRLTSGASRSEIDEFVELTSNQDLSTRDIDLLAEVYFKWGAAMREQLKSGDLGWTIQQIKERKREESAQSGLSESEQKIIRDLEIIHGCMGRLTLKLGKSECEKPGFRAQADAVCDGILGRIHPFETVLRGFYDRIRKTQCDLSSPSGRHGDPGDCPAAQVVPSHGEKNYLLPRDAPQDHT